MASSSSTSTPSASRALPDPDPRTFRSPIPPTRRPAGAMPGWRRPRDPSVLLALVAVAATLAVDASAVAVVIVVFALVVPFEMLFPRHGRRLRRDGLGTDIAYALVATPLGAVGTLVAAVVGVGSLAWLPGLLLRPLVAATPSLVRTLVGIVLFDVTIYWAHRWAHEVPFLWRFHAVHHSTRRLDWVSGFRNHPFDGVVFAPAFVLLLAAGFSAEFTGLLAVVQVLTGLAAHANVRWRLRPLHRFVITPEFHHWHHADEPGAINSNYAVFLPLWDLVFGTYFMPDDRRPQRYGVAEPMPRGVVRQLLHPFRGLRTPWQLARHPLRGVRDTVAGVRRGLCQMRVAAGRTSTRSNASYTP